MKKNLLVSGLLPGLLCWSLFFVALISAKGVTDVTNVSDVPGNVIAPSSESASSKSDDTPASQGAGGAASQQMGLLPGDLNVYRNQWQNRGFTFSPVLVAELFGNATGPERKLIFDGALNLSVDMNLEKLTGWWAGGTIHVDGIWIFGPGLSASVGDISNTSNVAGYNTVRLQELWLQQTFLDTKASIKVGMMAADAEFFTSTHASLFISGTFGAFTFVGSNLPNPPIYPMSAPGIRFEIRPSSKFYFKAGLYDGNTGSQSDNNHGMAFGLNTHDGALIFNEVGFTLNQSPNDHGLVGSYKLGAFVHAGAFNTWESQMQNFNGNGTLKNSSPDYGIYGVIDQELYHHGYQQIGLFARVGYAPADINLVNWYVDGGVNLVGFIPGRLQDVVGVAVSHSRFSGLYSENQVLQNNENYFAETVVEVTYQYTILPSWTVQPDFQYIFHPSGAQRAKDTAVFGLRMTLSF
jgi:porin